MRRHLASGLLVACVICPAALAAEPAMSNTPRASRAAPERQEIRAQLSPRRYTTLAAEIGARISRLHVQESGTFRPGQPLVSFDCGLQQAQLDRARAELNGAEKTLAANKRLLELNSVGQTELETSRAAFDRARAEVSANQVVASKCVVSAPFGGRVAEQKVREQQFVQPGQPLLDILDDSALELEFLVPSMWLTWLKPGARFEVAIDETGKTYAAHITRLGARVDPVSQSLKVVALISNPAAELMAGMSGRVLLSPPREK